MNEKTHYDDGVFTSMIDIVEGRMIVTNTLIRNDTKQRMKWTFWLLLKNELIEFGIWKSMEMRDDKRRN